MKKILSILIATMMLLTAVAVPSMAEEAKVYDETKWNLLAALDVIDEYDIPVVADENMTKGDFMLYLISLFGKYEEEYHGTSLFSDVDEGDDCYDAANIAKQLGWYPELEFEPRATVTYGEAAEMLVRAMGYSHLVNEGKLVFAMADAKIPGKDLNKRLTMSEMVDMFYAAIHQPLLKYDYTYGSELNYELDKTQTILSEYFDIEIIDGTVTHNGLTSLYSYKAYSKPRMEIDEVIYGDSKNLSEDFLGHRVRAYIDFSEDEEYGDAVFISDRGTEVIEIQSDDIDAVNDRVTRIDYTVDERSTYKSISENAKVIYNGKAIADYAAADLQPENGTVTLIDNNGDGTADVVYVWSYETIFVDRVANNVKTVYNAYEEPGTLSSLVLDVYDNDYTYEIFWEDDVMLFSDIQKYQVLSVARSKNADDRYIKIELSKKQVKGKIQAFDREEGTITVDGTAYPVLDEFTAEYPNLTFSESYIFYIDAFGNIAAVTEIDNENYFYAYLYRAAMNDTEDVAEIKVFTQDTDWMKYEIKDKVSYNDKNATPYELMYGIGNDIKRTGINVDKTTTNRQVVKLLTEGNVVKAIKTADENADIGEFNKASDTIYYRGQNRSFDSKFFVNNDTVVFQVPSDEPDNFDAYRVSATFSWDRQYNITAYGYDEYGDADVIVADIPVSTHAQTKKTVLVTNIVKALNSEGIPATMLRCSFGMYEQYDIEFEEGVGYATLNKGDIITISINEKGKITSYSKSYDYQAEGRTKWHPAQIHSDSYLRGTIVKVDPDNDRMIVDLGGTKPNQSVRLTYADLVIKRYDMRNNRVDVISAMQLNPGEFVVLDGRASYIYEVIAYKEID